MPSPARTSSALKRPSLLLLASLFALPPLTPTSHAQSAPQQPTELRLPSDAAFSKGVEEYQLGRYENAIAYWEAAELVFDRNKNLPHQLDVRLNLSAAYRAIGDYPKAEQALHAALEMLQESGTNDPAREIALRNALGSTLTFRQVYGEAEQNLTRALTLAEQTNDLRAQALIRNNLGNLHAARAATPPEPRDAHAYAVSAYSGALAAYTESHRLAQQLNDPVLAAKALTNASVAAVALAKENAENATGASATGSAPATANANANATPKPDFTDAVARTATALDAIRALPDSHDKTFLLLTAGQNDASILEFIADQTPAARAPASPQASAEDPDLSRLRQQLLLRAHATYTAALHLAKTLDDKRSLSHAYGYLGHLYELDRPARANDALALTHRALLLAQQIQAPELLYQWQWQAGRLLKATAKTPQDFEQATLAYQQAVATLQNIRNDLALGHGNRLGKQSFREGPGQLYFELADMLLRRADNAAAGAAPGADEQVLQQYLVQARDTVELLKAGELLDYFQDPCVSLLEKKRQEISNVGKGTAIVYLIPLRDRTEMLVSVAGGMKRFQVPVGSRQLTDEVNTLRRQLVSIRTERYFKHAVQLYNWLIAPIEGELQKNNVDTLVFVPDGALRTIPMAALYDQKSDQFLIAKYATVVSPGLTLMEPKPIPRQSVQILLNGLSEARGNFPALQYVPQELENVSAAVPTTRENEKSVLINEDFIKTNVRQKLRQEDYSIVHIASHGMFVSNSRDTFLLTYDGKLTLNELEQLLQPKQFQGRPVELLTLSACQTAVGDDRAALGLAGVAIKAGARSAVATLWSVNDEASADLITDFYQQLVSDPTLSKAKALQRAQLNLLKDERYTHPMYWSPFLIIGNWL